MKPARLKVAGIRPERGRLARQTARKVSGLSTRAGQTARGSNPAGGTPALLTATSNRTLVKPTPLTSASAPAPLRRTVAERRALALDEQQHPMMAELRRQAEAQLRQQRRKQKPELNGQKPATDAERTLHELKVQQIELEMQNTKLTDARDWMEELVEKYTDLYDFAPVGYFSLDEQGVIREVNLTGAALLGVERDQLVDGRFARFVAPASQPDFLAFLKRVFAGTGQEGCDLALVKEDGTDFWVRFRGTAALSASEVRKWCRVSVSDITALKQTDEALRESEGRFHVMADAMSQLAWMAQPDGFITWYNQRWFEYTGTTPEQMEGWGWQNVHDPEMLPKVLKRWKVSLAAGQPFDMTFPLRGADGGFRRFLTRAVPQKDKRGRVLRWFGTNTDIEDGQRAAETQRRLEVLAASNRKLELEIVRRKAGEEALKKSEQHQRQLLEEARLMQEQLRHLAHQILRAQEEERKRISRELHDEIAQTLTGINIRLANLKAGATGHAKNLQGKITNTQRLVEKSVEIVHRFARELRPSVLDDLGLIPALHSFVKTFAKETKLPIRLRVFAGVEKLDAAQRTVLYRVAQEALTNVARHARATEVVLCIEPLADAVHMKIHDNGRSFSVQRTLLAKKNGRLGLLGMRERVEMVGGRFAIKSAPGHGTTIEVQIPSGHGSKRKKTRLSKRPA